MRTSIRFAGWLFLVIGAIAFVKRSILLHQGFWDFPIIYVSSKAWLLVLCLCFMGPMSIASRFAAHFPASAGTIVNLFLIPFRVWALVALTLLVLCDPKPWHAQQSSAGASPLHM
jgi:hypothetical protein